MEQVIKAFEQAKLIYEHPAYMMKMATTQNPLKVWDVTGIDGAAGKYQALMHLGGITIWDSWDELIEAYPHVNGWGLIK